MSLCGNSPRLPSTGRGGHGRACEAWGTSTRNVFWPVLDVMLAQPFLKRTRLAPCGVARASSTVMREPTSSRPHGSLRRQCSPSRESNCQTQLASGRRPQEHQRTPCFQASRVPACVWGGVGGGAGLSIANAARTMHVLRHSKTRLQHTRSRGLNRGSVSASSGLGPDHGPRVEGGSDGNCPSVQCSLSVCHFELAVTHPAAGRSGCPALCDLNK